MIVVNYRHSAKGFFFSGLAQELGGPLVNTAGLRNGVLFNHSQKNIQIKKCLGEEGVIIYLKDKRCSRYGIWGNSTNSAVNDAKAFHISLLLLLHSTIGTTCDHITDTIEILWLLQMQLQRMVETCVPDDALIRILHDSGEELKFLIAVQPRVSSFSQRQRHSLRHPALAMATKRFFSAYQRLHAVDTGTDRLRHHGAGQTDSPIASMLADYMKEDGRPRRSKAAESEEDMWNDFAMAVSSSLHSFLQAYFSSGDVLSPRRSQSSSAGSKKGIYDLSISRPADFLTTVAEESESPQSSTTSRGRKKTSLKQKAKMRRMKLEADIKANTQRILKYEKDDDDEEEMRKVQDREDFYWAQVGRCYDMVLRCASVPCKMAALTAGVDGLLNDVIRRFWDRITVAAADKAAANDDLLDVERSDNDLDVDPQQTKIAAPTGGLVEEVKNEKGRKNRRGRRNSRKDDLEGGPAKRSSPETPRAKHKRQYAGTALYMSPLQYVYLNTRIAAALLPTKRELEIEMLQSIQEDLLLDSTYDESDLTQELYFGKAPKLMVPDGVMVDKNPNPRRGAATLRQRLFNNGSPSTWNDDNESVGNFSLAVLTGNADPIFQNTMWNTSRLPSLTYAQFWYSMMTLADNWTTSAANPIEYSLFLLELYSMIFSQDWDSDDEAMLKQFQVSFGEYETGEELRERMRQATAMLRTFNEMIEEMEEWNSSTDSDFMERINRATEGYAPGMDGYEEQSQKAKMTSEDFYSMLASEDTVFGKWKYITRVGKDGKVRHLRVKEILVRSKSKKKHRRDRRRTVAGGELGGNYSDEDEEGDEEDDGEFSQYTSSGSDYSVYVIEEELNSDGEVIGRRRRHKHRQPGESYEQYLKPINFDDSASDDEFMYTVVEAGMGAEKQRYLKRCYYDKPAKQLRRIEGPESRCDDYIYAVDANLSDTTSWSSYSSGESVDTWRSPYRPLQTEDERRQRVRHRVRRTGKRSERRRFGRKPNYYYQQEGYDMYSFSSYSLNDDYEEGEDGKIRSKNVSGTVGSGTAGAADGASQASALQNGEEGTSVQDELPDKLSDEQRAFLREQKAFLQRMLAVKGINISDEAFEKESEELVLWQLLQLALKHQKKVDAGEATDDDFGVANFDAALLAKIFANPETFSLDDLQRSELMRLLLEDEEGGGMALLSAAQMAGVLAALQLKPRNRLELPSERLRRERLMAKAREMHKEQKRIEKERRRAEREAEREAKLAELRAAKDALGKGEIFDLTETPEAKQKERMPSFDEDTSTEPASPTLFGTKLQGIPPPRHTPFPTQKPEEPSSSGSYHLDDLTKADRRRQQKLFREFQVYTAQQASLGRFKVVLTSYTSEQIEEFANHLHLGPKDRALLKGRAPLAEPSSLMGGTMHQLSYGNREKFGLGLDGVTTKWRQKQLTQLAPMKLFTLTTTDSLHKALWESYRQYIDDREYITDTTKGIEPPKEKPRSSVRKVPTGDQKRHNLPSVHHAPHAPRNRRPLPLRLSRERQNQAKEWSPHDETNIGLPFLASPSPVQLAYEEPGMELSNSRGLDDTDDDLPE
eukprot:gene5524-3984_t